MKLIFLLILILFTGFVSSEEPAQDGSTDLAVMGSSPAPPSHDEKGTIATLIAVYTKFKNAVKYMNRCYQTYKGIVYTYEQIDNFLRNFDDYWANVYGTFESAADKLKNAKDFDAICDALYGFEDAFKLIDNYWSVEVQYFDYLCSKDLSRGLSDLPVLGGIGDALDYEAALKIINDIYDNSKNIREVFNDGKDVDKSRSRATYEWDLFVTSQAMQRAGKINSQMKLIKQKIERYKDLGSELQTLGEHLAYQRLLLLSTWEMDLMEYQLSLSDLEVTKGNLIRENNNMYRDITNVSYDYLSMENMLSKNENIDPFGPSVFNDSKLFDLAQDVKGSLQ